MGLWNATRSVMGRSEPADQPKIKQEIEDDAEPIDSPTHFTGELPTNSIVSFNCQTRPNPLQFSAAVLENKTQHDDDKKIMPCKCPLALEWSLNSSWDAEERLQQRMVIAKKKHSNLWTGPLGQAAMELQEQIKDEWTIKTRQNAVTECLAHYKMSSLLENMYCSCGCAFVLEMEARQQATHILAMCSVTLQIRFEVLGRHKH